MTMTSFSNGLSTIKHKLEQETPPELSILYTHRTQDELDYGELDRAMLPKVKATVAQFLSTDERPRRVTLGAE